MTEPPEPLLPDPNPSSETVPFWQAAAEGVLFVRRCKSCGKAHWYPRTVCPFCVSSETEWIRGSGRGVVYSFSFMRRATPPFLMAFVTLEEGPTMMTNLVECDPETVRINDAVEVVFRKSRQGFAVPCFRPIRAPTSPKASS